MIWYIQLLIGVLVSGVACVSGITYYHYRQEQSRQEKVQDILTMIVILEEVSKDTRPRSMKGE